MKTTLFVGGLVAAGFDASGKFLLTISHSGRGVFSTETWQRIARDYEDAYPENGEGIGIGPIAGEKIAVANINSDGGLVRLICPNGGIVLDCESSGIAVYDESKGLQSVAQRVPFDFFG
jgi:hypothetical protein